MFWRGSCDLPPPPVLYLTPLLTCVSPLGLTAQYIVSLSVSLFLFPCLTPPFRTYLLQLFHLSPSHQYFSFTHFLYSLLYSLLPSVYLSQYNSDGLCLLAYAFSNCAVPPSQGHLSGMSVSIAYRFFLSLITGALPAPQCIFGMCLLIRRYCFPTLISGALLSPERLLHCSANPMYKFR